MAMRFVDRLLTVAVTATLTSAVWIVAGSNFMQPVEAEPVPAQPDAEQAGTAALRPATTAHSLPVAPQPANAGGLAIPVANVTPAQLSDSYADERGDGERLHEAIDIMAPAGTAVIAAAPGTIERLYASEAGGNTIYVRSPDRRTIHYYAHLSDYAPGLREGQSVARGQRLGSVGSSGNASAEAPHLHFAILRTNADAEWWEPAAAINPYPLLTAPAR